MSAEKNKAILRREMEEVWNKGKIVKGDRPMVTSIMFH